MLGAVAMGLVAVSCQIPANGALADSTGLERAGAPIESVLRDRAASGAPVRVIVTFDGVATRDQIARDAGNRTGRVGALSETAASSARGLGSLPQAAMTLEPSDLDRVAALPGVRSVTEDGLNRVALADATAGIGAPAVWSTGYIGVGQTVAILDTGLSRFHPFYVGRLDAESCFSANGTCNSLVTEQIGPGAARPCGVDPDCTHGTSVTGVAIGGDGNGGFSGVAPGATTIESRVFSELTGSLDCLPYAPPCIGAFDSDVIRGLEWVYSLKDTYDIAAVNLSLGGTSSTTVCDEDNMKPAVDQLRAAGIATVAASGNGGYKNRIASPACISSVLSVGAVTLPDTPKSYSNSAPFLDFFAPGGPLITSTAPGTTGDEPFLCPDPFSNSKCHTQQGTSMAAPFVTGALAVMRSMNPTQSIDEMVAVLKAGGVPVTDGATVAPRIKLDSLLQRPTFHPVTPARILDTRDGTGGPTNPLGPGETRTLHITGQGGIPTDGVSAVLMNVTAVHPTTTSFVTVSPTGTPRPLVSNLNLTPQQVRPNLVAVKVGDNGNVDLFNNSGQVDLVGDVAGWYDTGLDQATGATYTPITPTRILDTRNGTGAPTAKIGPGQAITIDATTPCPGPDTTAVTMNITAVNATELSHVTAWPADQPKPLASNLNFTDGAATPNLATIKTDPTGSVSLYNNSGTVDLIADLNGCYTPDPSSAGKTIAITPQRALDTRDGTGGHLGPIGSNQTITLDLANNAGIPPTHTTAAIINITVTDPTNPSHLTAWPGDQPKPDASNLNYQLGQTVPNLAIVKLGDNGTLNLYNNTGATHLIIDVFGFIAP